MSTQVIELEGFEIELASVLYCDRGGDHGELVDRARTDRRRLGHNVDESAVLCVRCHEANSAKPKTFPQVASAEHSSGMPCDTCHQPHSPAISGGAK